MISPNPHFRVVAGVTVISRLALVAWFPQFQRVNASACQNVLEGKHSKYPLPVSNGAAGKGGASSSDHLLAVRFADNRASHADGNLHDELLFLQQHMHDALEDADTKILGIPGTAPVQAASLVLTLCLSNLQPSEHGDNHFTTLQTWWLLCVPLDLDIALSS